MPKKVLPMIGALIALYLVVAYSKGTSSLITSGSAGSSNLIKTLQARA